MQKNKKKTDKELKKKKSTYHSSCHLRAAGVSSEQRSLLKMNPKLDFMEMPDADRSAGGAGIFCIKNPEQYSKILERKRQDIKDSSAETVATSCPACMIQLKDGLKDSVQVKHIAQVLFEEILLEEDEDSHAQTKRPA